MGSLLSLLRSLQAKIDSWRVTKPVFTWPQTQTSTSCLPRSQQGALCTQPVQLCPKHPASSFVVSTGITTNSNTPTAQTRKSELSESKKLARELGSA